MSQRHIAIVFCVLAGACGGMTPRIAPATDDATLTVRVRTALLNDPAVHGSEIAVMTQNGVVILRGQVHGQSEANAAIAAARRIEGVRDVQSELQPSR
jgi:osmotically-inducible protein OsmY